ncbi:MULTISPECIES: hypothetical protein [Clostridium]|uniref:hypothetical protein n=1 Tax=Clostridium TaxID=1485 RepID=UPI0012FE3EE8|nr:MULTISPECIES: hypothetical protein [Clostridium]
MIETVKRNYELESENKELKELLEEALQLLEIYNFKLKERNCNKYENSPYFCGYRN